MLLQLLLKKISEMPVDGINKYSSRISSMQDVVSSTKQERPVVIETPRTGAELEQSPNSLVSKSPPGSTRKPRT